MVSQRNILIFLAEYSVCLVQTFLIKTNILIFLDGIFFPARPPPVSRSINGQPPLATLVVRIAAF